MMWTGPKRHRDLAKSNDLTYWKNDITEDETPNRLILMTSLHLTQIMFSFRLHILIWAPLFLWGDHSAISSCQPLRHPQLSEYPVFYSLPLKIHHVKCSLWCDKNKQTKIDLKPLSPLEAWAVKGSIMCPYPWTQKFSMRAVQPYI